MTNTALTWIGIVSQAIPTIIAILMVTAGNRRGGIVKNKQRFIQKHSLSERGHISNKESTIYQL